MTIKTASGAEYRVVGFSPKGLMKVSRNDEEAQAVVAVFDDRLPCFEDTVKWGKEGHCLVGFNRNGVRTLRFDPTQVRIGMRLVNPRGLRSTKVVAVVK